MKAIVVGILVLLPRLATADILSWRDTNGVMHYTNLKGEVPKEQRESVQVVVDEAARQTQTGEVNQGAPAPAAQEPARREAQVIYDRSTSSAYLEGLLRGLETAGVVSGGAGGDVQINGPLAVANAASPAPYGYGSYPYPLVTTSFDRGRSRHLTLRQLLEEQFAIDRDGPFIFDERFIPPFGHPPLTVQLNPFLPRGLPHRFPSQARLITR